ncbi:hypothetical protein G7Y89_g13406 [Cudoniella acicularis]|uniref:Uncharacterized protein n=1 Tax=Cudoniella acicularis TaxID=354080 RepID=A0A8H4VW36_9HELO|nr:hypothetical protein G7Y89_g13406 [Cudoniella acicularis]
MEETNLKSTTDLPARPKHTKEGPSSEPSPSTGPDQDSTGEDATDKTVEITASQASLRILAPKFEAPTVHKEEDLGKGSQNPTNDKIKPASTSKEEAPVDWDLLNQPEVYDDDEDPNFVFACSQNKALRYFNKRSPEWWAEYKRAVKIAENAPLPEDYDL